MGKFDYLPQPEVADGKFIGRCKDCDWRMEYYFENLARAECTTHRGDTGHSTEVEVLEE